MTKDDTDLTPDGKPWFRLADDEDIANMSTAFTLPGRLAKQLADRKARLERQQEQDLSSPVREDPLDPSRAKS
jgi:hypothetical protein